MTFITRTFEEFSGEEIELLRTTPPTEESRELAERVGKRMGEYAFPGDLVIQSVEYEGGERGWPSEITALIGKLAFNRLQRR